MDLITHAITGACTGAMFGEPIVGAIMGVTPDLVLGIKRRATPTPFYNAMHSIPNILLSCLLLYALSNSLAIAAAAGMSLVSHIVLDLPTHGPVWAPPLFHPFNHKRFNLQQNEWEWFNDQWWDGLEFAAIWSCVCLSLTVIYT